MTALSVVATRAGAVVSSCVLAALSVVGALSLMTSRTPGVLVVLVGGAVALVVLLVVPVHVLPVLALVIITVVPDRLTDFTTAPLVTPATVVLAVWVVRRLLLRVMVDPGQLSSPPDQPGLTGLRRITVVLGVIMVPLVVVAPVHQFAISWTLTYTVAILAILQVGPIDREASNLRTALPWAGTAAAVYAVLQTVWEDNVIYTPLYETLGKVDVQHWAVYRADGSLGHPLLAGLFFAIVLTFCLGRWFETGQRRFIIPALVNGIGIVCTVSRGSYVAAALGVVALLVVAMLTGRLGSVRLAVILTGLTLAGYLALNSDSFVQRAVSVEGLASLNSRDALPDITLATAAAHYWLGGGPANSMSIAAPFNYQGLPIENSWFQLVISIGVPGTIAFAGILVLSAVLAYRARNLAALGALVAYAVAITGFAALDTRRNLLVLLGILMMLCLARRSEESEESAPTPVRSSRPADAAARAAR